MKISPVLNRFNNIPKFKSSRNSNGAFDEKPKSYQKNETEIYFHDALYDLLLLNLNNKAALSAGLINEGEDVSAFFSDAKTQDSQPNLKDSADQTIRAIKADAYVKGLTPEDLKDKVFPFVQYSSKEFIDNLYYTSELLIKSANRDSRPFSFLKNLIIGKKDTDENEQLSTAHKMEMGTRYKIFADFLSEQEEKLQSALDMKSDAFNYKLYSILINGFNSNPRGVLLALTSNSILKNNYTVETSDDGSLVYTYKDSKTVLTIKRNRYNLDYISAHAENAETDDGFDVQFYEDGSIRSLYMLTESDQSNIYIEQDKSFNSAMVQRYSDKHLESWNMLNMNGRLIQLN